MNFVAPLDFLFTRPCFLLTKQAMLPVMDGACMAGWAESKSVNIQLNYEEIIKLVVVIKKKRREFREHRYLEF